ncbi:serine hydrolase domain-containing protein [Actinoplanes sp. NPDC048791]|uniref:serine hydrolase domain-containing protein n=1 Tax=Actinoplanes sp. NPDC048791 TaxID=3154623 RepID=UPI00340904B9
MDEGGVAELIERAGYGPQEPVAVAIRRPGAEPTVVTRPANGPAAESMIYIASLAKQMTAACLALLVRRGQMDTETSARHWLPDLPSWADAVRLRHLLHHTAGLPGDARLQGPGDRTSVGMLTALKSVPAPEAEPGSRFAYSNAGYILLAAIVERATAQPLPDFARDHLFAPLGMSRTLYWPGPSAQPLGAIPIEPPHPAPLSLGDGGVWSTPADLLRWGDALNEDRLHISGLLQTPGFLDDGTPLDYAWGLGVRVHRGRRVYRHGGGWQHLRLLLARSPDAGLTLLTVALRDPADRHIGLTDDLLDRLLG